MWIASEAAIPQSPVEEREVVVPGRLRSNLGRILTGGNRERTLLRRKALYRGIARFSPLVGVQTSYGLFVVDGRDRGPGESLFAFHEFDDFETLKLAVSIATREGRLAADVSTRTFVEVGANIGSTTVPALSVIGFGRAQIAEPAPTNLRLLRANLALNDLTDRVVVMPVGVGASLGTTTLWVGQENHGDHRLWQEQQPGLQPTRRGVDVTVVTLDSVIGAPTEAGIVWVDTQGFEGFVLVGATNLRDAGVPFVTEFWPYGMRAAGSWELFVEIVASAAYLVDLGTGECHTSVDRRVLEALAAKYDGVLRYTDLLFWFDERVTGAEASGATALN